MRLCEHRDFQQAVGPQLVSVIAWSGSGPSGHPVLPITQGLTGSAIAQGSTIVVGDVKCPAISHSLWQHAFGDHCSSNRSGLPAVVGTIDVESDRINAFSARDGLILEGCARSARALWR